MAITFITNGTASSTASSSTIVSSANLTVATASKQWVLVLIAASNDGTSGAATITGVVDSGGVNSYVQRALINYSPGSATSDGTTLGIYTCQVTSDVSSGTVTASFSPNTTIKSLLVYRLTPGAGETISFIDCDATGSTGNGTSHSTSTVSVTSGDVIINAIALESNDTVTGDSDTTNGSWTAYTQVTADGGTDDTAQQIGLQRKAVTATGNQSWACTTPGAMDSARSYIVFRTTQTDFIVTDLASGTSITSTTTVATGATVTGVAASGDWFVAIVATANSGTSGAAPTITLADGGGTNVYTQQAKINYTPTAAASDGATLGIYTAPVTADITNGTITATLGTAAGEKAIQVYRVRPPTGETISVTAVDTTGSTGNATSLAAATVSVTSGDVIFGACAAETDDAITGDSDTTNGSWSTVVTRLADAGTDPTTMSCISQYKVVTATGNQSWAATVGTARDSARTYLILGSATSAKTLDATTPGSYALTGTDATTRRNLPLVPDSGSYALTGTDATVFRNLPMVADPGDYLLTGTDATLTLASPNKTITADAGSYALTGTDVTLTQLFNKAVTADAESYTLLGTDAATTHQWKLDATTAGSYALTGTDASTTHQWKLDATTAASYALTGTDVTLRHGFFIAAELGTYALTGTDATLRRNLPMVADAGSYLLTGTDAATTHQWKLDATVAGSYALTGTDVALTLASNKVIAAEVGSYTLTGTDATLTKASNNKTLTVDAGSYSLTGTDTPTTHQWKLDATTTGSYSLAGQDANLLHKWQLDATTAGAYALTGTDAGTYYGRKVDATTAGSYALTGTDAGTYYGRKLDATAPGSYALTGTDATLRRNLPMVAEAGSYLLLGTDAATTHQWKLDATVPGSYALTGTDVSLTTTGAFAITADSGSYALTGTDVTLTKASNNKTIVADSGSYVMLGVDAGTYYGRKLDATVPGNYALNGNDATPILVAGKFVIADPGAYALAGTDVTLTKTTLGAFTITADSGSYLLTGTPVTLTPSAQPPIIVTRGEWPEKERKKRRKQREEQRIEAVRTARRARDSLRESLTRLYEGSPYDAPTEALEEIQTEALATVNAIGRLPDLPLREMQVIEDLIRRIQEVVRQRLLDDMQTEAATQIAQAHLADSIIIADEVYRRTRQNYLIKTLLLIAE